MNILTAPRTVAMYVVCEKDLVEGFPLILPSPFPATDELDAHLGMEPDRFCWMETRMEDADGEWGIPLTSTTYRDVPAEALRKDFLPCRAWYQWSQRCYDLYKLAQAEMKADVMKRDYYYEDFKTLEDVLKVCKDPEAIMARNPQIGDLVSFSDYRNTWTYIVGPDGVMVKNTDGDGYLSIPLSISEHFWDVTARYRKWLDCGMTTIALPQGDRLLVEMGLPDGAMSDEVDYTYALNLIEHTVVIDNYAREIPLTEQVCKRLGLR